MSISVGIDVVSNLVYAALYRLTLVNANVSRFPSPLVGAIAAFSTVAGRVRADEACSAPSSVLSLVRGSRSYNCATIPFSSTTN